jgi:Amt family ammonium transporter
MAFGKIKTYFVGTTQFSGEDYEHTHHFSEWVFQTAVAMAANSIVSGGAAERMTYIGYIGLSFGFSGWIYPIAAHWGFGGGWLMNMGYHDFAGDGTVHAVGGVGALVLTIMLKPRKNRYNEKYAEHFEPSNPTYITLATLSV